MRQRSKAELLQNIRAYKILQNDMKKEEGKRVAGGVSYWRTSVEWVYVLWQSEHVSKSDLVAMMQYVASEISNMDDSRREKIRNRMSEVKCDLLPMNLSRSVRKNMNIIDATCAELGRYNAEVQVDYSLLAIEWLMDNRNFSKKRIDRVMELMVRADLLNMESVFKMRQLIYNKKGIWITLNEEDAEENMEKDEDVEMIVI